VDVAPPATLPAGARPGALAGPAGAARTGSPPARGAQRPHRVAADPERDLAHRVDRQPGGGLARLRGAVPPGRHRVRPRLGHGHARRALLAHVGQGHGVRRLPGLHAGPHGGGHRPRGGRGVLRLPGRPARRGRHGGRRPVLPHGLLHPRPRRGARRGVQGGHRLAGRPRRDPVRRPAPRGGPGRRVAARAGGVRPRRPGHHHDVPAHLPRARAARGL
ncbi:MAG: Phosphatidylinositol phosphate synthase @ Archaetidylinositol phosphate synthase, partial [uncultured Solirubrobacteraceae bacterium]